MQGVLNQNEFDNPRRFRRWHSWACGWRHLDSPHEGGIWNPLEVKLRRGQVLFRVGHSRSERGPMPPEISLSSPWWMEAETFADIAVSSNVLGLDAQKIARLKLSVSERYGVFDTIICVRLLGELGALRGKGNPVYDPPEPGSTQAPPVWAFPGRQVMQCFVPGLSDFHKRPSGLADTAFEVLATRPVSSWLRIGAEGF